MFRKFKFYALGLIPGILLVFFILNKKGASCTGYLPNSRVIAETLSKKMVYDPVFSEAMTLNRIDETIMFTPLNRENIKEIVRIQLKGVTAMAKPMFTTSPMVKILLASDTAANSVAPRWPTIIVSAKPTIISPACDRIIGKASLKLGQ